VNYKSYLERQIKERFDDLDECPDTKSRCKNIPASRELLNTMHRYTHTTTGESTQLYILYRATLDRDWQRLVKVISSRAYYSWTQRWSIDCCHFGRQYSWNFFATGRKLHFSLITSSISRIYLLLLNHCFVQSIIKIIMKARFTIFINWIEVQNASHIFIIQIKWD